MRFFNREPRQEPQPEPAFMSGRFGEVTLDGNEVSSGVLFRGSAKKLTILNAENIVIIQRRSA